MEAREEGGLGGQHRILSLYHPHQPEQSTELRGFKIYLVGESIHRMMGSGGMPVVRSVENSYYIKLETSLTR